MELFDFDLKDFEYEGKNYNGTSIVWYHKNKYDPTITIRIINDNRRRFGTTIRWYKNGDLHRDDGAALRIQHKNSSHVLYEVFYENGVMGHSSGMARRTYFSNGNLYQELFKHTPDNYLTKTYYNNGTIHKISRNVEKNINSKMVYNHHCIYEPAIQVYGKDGTITDEQWFVNGKLISKLDIKKLLGIPRNKSIKYPLLNDQAMLMKLRFE